MCGNFLFQVTGKALMLDEIINYVQSLQRQVEVNRLKQRKFKSCRCQKINLPLFFLTNLCFFNVSWQFLSMKLASVNPGLDFNMENLLSKDVSLSLSLSLSLNLFILTKKKKLVWENGLMGPISICRCFNRTQLYPNKCTLWIPLHQHSTIIRMYNSNSYMVQTFQAAWTLSLLMDSARIYLR